MTKSPGRQKGGRIAAAKRKAKRTGRAVDLPQYGMRIEPDGTVYQRTEKATVSENANAAAPAAQELKEAPAEGSGAPQAENAPTGENTDPVRSYMAELLAKGISGQEAMTLVTSRFGGGDRPGAQAPATPGAGEQLGPDPEHVRRYKAMLESYVPPKLQCRAAALDKADERLARIVDQVLVTYDLGDNEKRDIRVKILDGLHEYGGIELPKRFFDWVVQYAAWETGRRRLDRMMPLDQVIGIMIREHWHGHPQERALLQQAMTGGGGSGPAGLFKPQEGGWSG